MENDRKEIIRIEGLEKFYQLGTQQVKALNGASLKICKNEYFKKKQEGFKGRKQLRYKRRHKG